MSLRSGTFRWVGALVASLMIGFSLSASESPEALIEKAREALTSASDYDDLSEALELTDQALKEDAAYVPAHNTRIHILVKMGRLDDVALQARRLYEVEANAANHLYWCMAREAAGQQTTLQRECYADVVARIEEESEAPETEVNYVLALKLLRSPRFEEVAARYIADQETVAAQETARFQLIERDRETVIKDLFGQ